MPPGNPSHKLQAAVLPGQSGNRSWKELSSGWGPMTPPYSYLGDRKGAQALRAFSALSHESQSKFVFDRGGEPEAASIWGSPSGIAASS